MKSVQRITTGIVCLFSLLAGVAVAQTTFNSGNGVIQLQADNSSSCGSTAVCKADVYPSPLTVSGLTGSLSNITVTLRNLNIVNFQNAIFILTSPGGNTLLFYGGGNCLNNASGETIGFNDGGSPDLQGSTFPDCNSLSSGTHKPTSNGENGINFPSLGTIPNSDFPTADGVATFVTGTSARFNGLTGTNLNGTWNLYVLDGRQQGVSGTVGSGGGPAWSLTITTNAAATATATTVTSSLNPSFTGDTVTFTATVASSSTVNGGTVTFSDGVTALACTSGSQTVASGVATCGLSTLTEGAHSITATYGGNGGFVTSSSPAIVQVVNDHTTAQVSPPSGTHGFCNTGAITIPGPGANGDDSQTGAPAKPYASEIFVSGLSGTIENIEVLLNGFTSVDPQTVGLLLAGPNSKNLDFFSWAGASAAVSGLNLTFDDSASSEVPSGSSPSSTSYKPTSYVSAQPTVYCQSASGCNSVIVSEPAPASFTKAGPAGQGTLLSQFGGANPNGTWQLFAVERITGETASIGSWCLNFLVSTGAPSTTAVSGSPNASFTSGTSHAVTITATVTNQNSPNSPVNDGTVTFSDNGTNLVCTGGNPAGVSNGIATCATSFSTEGDHNISASFGFSSTLGVSSGTYTQRVDNHTTASLNNNVYSFCNAGPVDIPNGGANHNAGPGGPDPENIFVAGLPGTINKVTLSLNGYTSNFPSDIDMMLLGPCQTQGCTPTAANGIDFFSRVGGSAQVSNANLTFDDAGATVGASVSSATYRPTSGSGSSSYSAPAPLGPYQYAAPQGSTTFASVFQNDNPNGTWSLYGQSTVNGAYATITGSPAVCLNFTENAPDITITKTNSPNHFRQGDSGDTFTITVTNNGPGSTGDPTGTNPVKVVDTLPAGLTASAISGPGWTCILGTLTCTRSDALASGSYPTITVTVNVAATAGASVTNTAVVSGGGDNSPGNNTATDIVTVDQASDLTIAKSHTGPFKQGDTASANDTYTITVSNASGRGATINTVTVTDTLPTGLTASSIGGTGWTCDLSSVTCTRSDALASGSSYSVISLVVTVANNTASSVTNSVTVSGGGEFNTANDTATDVTTITLLPDLTISKTPNGTFHQGDASDTYTITTGNAAGAGPTSGTVTVVDTLPTGLTATAIGGSGWSCALGTLTCSRSDALNGGSNYSAITLTVSVAGNAPSSVTNTATVSGGGEINTANDTANAVTPIGQAPDLTIAKSHSTQFKQGDTADNYTITVSNAGPGAVVAGNTVTVVDTLPAGLTGTALSGTGWTCTLGTLTCTRADALAASSSYSAITLTVGVASNASSSVTNSVTVSGGGELNTANDSATDVTTIGQAPDLTIAKSHTGNFFQGQQSATYTITVSNAGPGSTDGSQVLVTDTLPSGLTFVSMSGSGWTCPGTGQIQSVGRPTAGLLRSVAAIRVPSARVSSGHTCSQSGVLTSGSSYPSITVTVNVDSNAPTSVTNSGTVSGGGELNTANDTATDLTTISGGPDLTIAKSHIGNFNVNDVGDTYTITVSNVGGAASAGTVTVTDTLPTGLSATAMSGTGWSCTVGTLTCNRSDALNSSSAYPAITLTVNVAANAPASVTNSASVSGGGDVNSANNSASDITSITQTVQVTVGTNISGPTISVDSGTAFTGTQIFNWVIGSSHTVATSSPQTSGTTQYVWLNWSDAGAISHSVTAPSSAASLTANFKTQYMLTTQVSPSITEGSISPASGFVDAGSVISVSATANSGYAFTGFSGGLSGTTTPQNVTVNAPTTVTANFAAGQTSLGGSIGIKSGPQSARVWPFTIGNNGPGVALGAQITSLTLVQTTGTACTPVIVTSMPASAGDIGAHVSSTVNVTINFTGCATNAFFKATAILSANGGAATGSIVKLNQLQ